MSPGERRPYRSVVRERAAAATRDAIVASATALFLRNGFARTTTKAIAARAGVTERMIFLNFEGKAALLAACIREVVRGNDPDTPMLARAEWQAVLAAPAGREMFGLIAAAVTQLYGRAAELLALGESASRDDPLLEEERRQGHAAMRADLLEVAKALKRAGALRRGITVARAADVLFALAGSHEIYLRLVEECGWPSSRYEETLRDAMLGPLAP